MKSALLRGRDYLEYGAMEVIAEGRAAVAISIGGARKRYGHKDPNEDAALFATGAGGTLVAVADGHDGASGSEAALADLLEHRAEAWTGAGARTDEAGWRTRVLEALCGASDAILRAAAAASIPPAPTTLSIALARPGDDLLLCASVGDSHTFQAVGSEVRDRGWGAESRSHAFFLGYMEERPEGLADKCAIHCEPLAGTQALVLVTDGLSERGIGVADPARAVADALAAARAEKSDLRPLHACKGVTEAAMEAQRRNNAGDNIGTALLWLGD